MSFFAEFFLSGKNKAWPLLHIQVVKAGVNSFKITQVSLFNSGFFSPVLRLQEQQNFRNLEFRREILEFSKKSFHFDGGNLDFPLSLEEKSCILAKTLSSQKIS